MVILADLPSQFNPTFDTKYKALQKWILGKLQADLRFKKKIRRYVKTKTSASGVTGRVKGSPKGTEVAIWEL